MDLDPNPGYLTFTKRLWNSLSTSLFYKMKGMASMICIVLSSCKSSQGKGVGKKIKDKRGVKDLKF